MSDYLRSAYFSLFAASVSLIAETHTLASRLVQEPVFERLGLTDAAIAQLARDEALTVVTADLDLHLHLLTLGVATVNFSQGTTLAAFVQDLQAN